jgi:NAD(P)-dependent dehydrogenase (short-subunit alcohol dehydrogenase family)
MTDISFANKCVMITGASGALGSAVVRKLAGSNAHLVLLEHGHGKLGVMFPEITTDPSHMVVEGVDVTDPVQIREVTGKAYERFNRLDILINTVGGYHGGTRLHETPLETWDLMLNLNARPVFILAGAVVPYMLDAGFGRIINVSARAGLQGGPKQAVYSAAKSAVIRLTESLAAELKDSGITANCILPGTIDTPENRANSPNADFSRWVPPDAIADAILFLASDEAQSISGASIPVYGQS